MAYFTPDQLESQRLAAATHLSGVERARSIAGHSAREHEHGRDDAPPLHPALVPGCLRCFVVGERTVHDGVRVGALGDLVAGDASLLASSAGSSPALDAPTVDFDGELLPAPGAETWVTSGGTAVIATGQADPFGGTSAVSIGDDSAVAFESARPNEPSYASGSPVRCELWVRKDEFATSFPQIALGFDGTFNDAFSFDPISGAVDPWLGAVKNIVVDMPVDDWWRVRFGHEGAPASSVAMRFYPAEGTSYPTRTVAATGTHTVYGPSIRTPRSLVLAGGAEALIGTGDFFAVVLVAVADADQEAAILRDDANGLGILVSADQDALVVVVDGSEYSLGGVLPALVGVPTVVEVEYSNGVLTLRAGAAGSQSWSHSREPASGTLRVGDDGAGGAMFAGKLGVLAGFDGVPDLATKRRIRAWLMERYSLGGTAFAEW